MVRRLWGIGLVALLILGCRAAEESSADKRGETAPPRILAVNYPLEYFADRIAGDLCEIQFPAPKQVDPQRWRPGPDEIRAFQTADLILLNGAGYAQWVAMASLPTSKFVNTSAAFKGNYLKVEQSLVHTHGPQGAQSETEIAVTTWMDFSLAQQQATAIADSLVTLMPEAESSIREQLDLLLSDLDQLDQEMLLLASMIKDRPILAARPVYQYVSKRYGFNLKSVQWESNALPSEEAVSQLDKLLEQHAAKVMIWPESPSNEVVELLRSKKIESVVFDPCENRRSGGDWLAVMKANIANLQVLK